MFNQLQINYDNFFLFVHKMVVQKPDSSKNCYDHRQMTVEITIRIILSKEVEIHLVIMKIFAKRANLQFKRRIYYSTWI